MKRAIVCFSASLLALVLAITTVVANTSYSDIKFWERNRTETQATEVTTEATTEATTEETTESASSATEASTEVSTEAAQTETEDDAKTAESGASEAASETATETITESESESETTAPSKKKKKKAQPETETETEEETEEPVIDYFEESTGIVSQQILAYRNSLNDEETRQDDENVSTFLEGIKTGGGAYNFAEDQRNNTVGWLLVQDSPALRLFSYECFARSDKKAAETTGWSDAVIGKRMLVDKNSQFSITAQILEQMIEEAEKNPIYRDSIDQMLDMLASQTTGLSFGKGVIDDAAAYVQHNTQLFQDYESGKTKEAGQRTWETYAELGVYNGKNVAYVTESYQKDTGWDLQLIEGAVFLGYTTESPRVHWPLNRIECKDDLLRRTYPRQNPETETWARMGYVRKGIHGETLIEAEWWVNLYDWRVALPYDARITDIGNDVPIPSRTETPTTPAGPEQPPYNPGSGSPTTPSQPETTPPATPTTPTEPETTPPATPTTPTEPETTPPATPTTPTEPETTPPATPTTPEEPETTPPPTEPEEPETTPPATEPEKIPEEIISPEEADDPSAVIPVNPDTDEEGSDRFQETEPPIFEETENPAVETTPAPQTPAQTGPSEDCNGDGSTADEEAAAIRDDLDGYGGNEPPAYTVDDGRQNTEEPEEWANEAPAEDDGDDSWMNDW